MAIATTECSREELNEKAHLLSEKAAQVRDQQCLVSSLAEQCMQLRTAINQLRSESARHPAPPAADKESRLGLLLRQRRLQAEIDVWKQPRPESGKVTEEETKRKFIQSVDELKMNLKSVKEEKKTVSNSLDRDKQYLKESLELAKALKQKVREREREKKTETSKNISDKSQLGQVREMLEKSEALSEELRQQMEHFIEEHLTVAADNETDPHQTTLTQPVRRKTPTLSQLLKKLLDRCLGSPHNPYLSLEGVKEDHFLLLWRLGLVERHPSRHSLIRLTPFHH